MNKNTSISDKKRTITHILAILKRNYVGKLTQLSMERKKADATGLNQNSTAFRILISTILSHRTKDEKTTQATNNLFSVYSSANELSNAPLTKIEKLISPAGFYRSKAKYIRNCSKQLVEKYHGVVPFSRESLMELDGVGPKTSACVLNYAFSSQVIAVDTHVHRIANRLGLVKTKTPEESEVQLAKITPIKLQNQVNELLVLHGQNTCKPIGPRCSICPVNKLCDYSKNQNS